MKGLWRYFRLFGAFARLSLATELAFRANFLVKFFVEALWLGILVAFYLTIFRNTSVVATWDRNEYFFFLGCHYALGGLIDTLFLTNCTEFPDRIRSGDLDMDLLKPIDEQFLVSCRSIDWSTAPNVVQGAVIMAVALVAKGWQFDAGRVAAFLALFGCGLALAYSFLLMLTATSVWFVRNQSLMEMWWLFTTLMRYPREIFRGRWATPFGLVFTFAVPVILVVNVPAHTMVKMFDWRLIGYTVAATAAMLVLSRRFFRYALRSYRSASS